MTAQQRRAFDQPLLGDPVAAPSMARYTRPIGGGYAVALTFNY
jgi:hypothetical protein